MLENCQDRTTLGALGKNIPLQFYEVDSDEEEILT